MSLIFDNSLDISFGVMKYSIEQFVLTADFLKIDLKNERHRVEKERNVKNSICHREDLPCYCMWHKISESDRCGRNHSKVKCIKITPVLCLLKSVYKQTPKKPTEEKDETYDNKFLMMNMK